MVKKIQWIGIIICLSLTACGTGRKTPPPPAETETVAMQDPAYEAAQKIKTAKINAQLGLAYLEKNNVQRAKQKLLLALSQGPNISETWYSMAYFLETTGNLVEAQQHYLKAIALNPKRGDVHNNYGTFLCRKGAFNAAIGQFDLAAKDPDYLNPAAEYENAGLCALKIPNKKLARIYFTKAIMHDPSKLTSYNKLAELDSVDHKKQAQMIGYDDAT